MLHKLMAPRDPEQDVHPLDRLMHGWVARFSQGISPTALSLAYFDWVLHLATYPGKQVDLAADALRKAAEIVNYASRCGMDSGAESCVKPGPEDPRFEAPEWQRWPFNIMHQAFLLTQQWWQGATSDVRGVDPHHQEVVSFMGRQFLDMLSPSNFLLTNPEILDLTFQQQGQNLVRGYENMLEDMRRRAAGEPPVGVEDYKVGENLALTPGKVIYRNRLMELIQYEPRTKTTYAEPVLFVPAWIMKYYILDLRPGKSIVEYLLEQGHTVFMISWKNPGTEDRDLGMEDYLRLGVLQALDVVNAVVPEQKTHAVGYCLGGTLLSIAAATLAREGDERLASVTMFAAQTDFTEPGELDLFIDESQVTFLEDNMWEKGYLTAYQMAGAFQLLRSQDLIWSRLVRDYLVGERAPVIDLMAWNADSTRLPYRMHSEYLRELFLNNDLAEGRYDVGGEPIHLGNIRAPIFAVGTVKDHVAPWKSVYKINRFTRTDVTFLLTTGGHNAGIMTPPGHPRRKYQMHTRKASDHYVSAERFHDDTAWQQGSWWPAWEAWLREHSGKRVPAPAMGAPEQGYAPIADAPGSYVLEQ